MSNDTHIYTVVSRTHPYYALPDSLAMMRKLKIQHGIEDGEMAYMTLTDELVTIISLQLPPTHKLIRR